MFRKFKIIDEIKKYKFQYIIALISSIFLSIISESISRKSIALTIKWIISNPLSFLIMIVLIFALKITLGTVFFNYRIGNILVTFFILLLSILNRIKYDTLGISIIPTDIFLIKEAKNITNAVNVSKYTMLISIGILILFIWSYIIIKLTSRTSSKKFGVLNLIIGLLIISSVISSNALEDGDYLSKGFIVDCISKLDYVKSANVHLDYDKKLIDEFIKENRQANNKNTLTKKANIVAIMSEAFWDINWLDNIEIIPNPMKEFEALKKESIYGKVEVPVFGGGTSNTEFEVLTGFSTHFYDDGYMMYPNEVKHPFMSLASVLRNQGYYTTGIHPFWGWYYNRYEVYEYFGFNQFITDDYLIDGKLKGYYVSDEVVTDLIIDQIEKSDEPQFIFAVTMQNHGPYDDARYSNIDLDIDVKGDLDEVSKEILKTYAQGVYDANKALARLIEYLKNIDEPTILLFFGDHLPLMGEDFKVYRDCGYINDNESFYDKVVKIKTTPFIIWSNYEEKAEDIGIIDATFLGAYLLNEANVNIPNYYKFLMQLYEEISAINSKFALDKKGEYIYDSDEKYSIFNEKLKALQFDLMYGNKRVEDNYSSWIITDNSSINSEINEIKINNVFVKNNDLIIEGEKLYPKGRLFINDNNIEFEYINTNKIVIRDYKTKLKGLRGNIQFKLIDTIEKILAESNVYLYKLE